MQTIIEGTVGRKAEWGVGVIWRLKVPVADKHFAVINYETIGLHKAVLWETGTNFSLEAKYKVGPDALMITEIL